MDLPDQIKEIHQCLNHLYIHTVSQVHCKEKIDAIRHTSPDKDTEEEHVHTHLPDTEW